MRHSDINLTMGIYTHAQTEQVKAAINNLPDFQKQTQIMTGTDDKPADAIGFEVPEKNTPENTLVYSVKRGFDCLRLARKGGESGGTQNGQNTLENGDSGPKTKQKSNTPERTRTSDLWFRKPMLYPAELRARMCNDAYLFRFCGW